MFDNKKILVTGGTGSFGHQFVKMTPALQPSEDYHLFKR